MESPKYRVLAVLAAVWALGGVLEGLVPQYSATASVALLVETLATALLALLWVRYDAAERGLRVSGRLAVAICLVAVLGVPYYLLKSRGWRGLPAVVAAAALLIRLGILSGVVSTLAADLYFRFSPT